MSSTFKINGSFVTDPKTASWKALTALVVGAIGQPSYSRMRSAVCEFTPLTPAQYLAWWEACDKYPDGYVVVDGVTLPRRTDAAYTTNPEAGSVTTADPTKMEIDLSYAYHFLGGSPGPGGKIYNTRVEVYTFVRISLVPPP